MRVILVLMFLAISGCANLEGKRASDFLIGTWVINHDISGVDYSVIEYQANGDKCEVLFDVTNGLDVVLYWNKWRLENGVIHTTMHNTTGSIAYGFKIGDKIATLTRDDLIVDIVIPEGDFQTEYHRKNHRAQSGQVCNLVRSAFNNLGKQDAVTGAPSEALEL